MIHTDIKATMNCAFEGCTNQEPGHLVFSQLAGFAWFADRAPLPKPWLMTMHPEKGPQEWCPLHHSHAPKVVGASVMQMPKGIQ